MNMLQKYIDKEICIRIHKSRNYIKEIQGLLLEVDESMNLIRIESGKGTKGEIMILSISAIDSIFIKNRGESEEAFLQRIRKSA